MSISFEDFLLYTKAPEADIKIFSVIAPGVIAYLEEFYGIFIEQVLNKEITYFARSTGTTFELPISPINSISLIKYNEIEQPFTFYGNDIVLTNSITDIRKPVLVTVNVGYTNVPQDLKLAVYQHIESLYFRAKNSSDNIEKVTNTSGSTTYFREDSIPKFSKDIYNRYSNRLIAYY